MSGGGPVDRRTAMAAMAGSAALLAAARAGAASEAGTVATTAGPVRGTMDGGIHVFRGIPYGASTAGAARFLPPRPRTAWKGVFDAIAYGPDSPHRRPDQPLNPKAAWPNLPESEDCLVANVWTPSIDDHRKRPVMVWLHGGGFISGSASAAREAGTALARRGDVVIVSVNHRLGVMGHAFLDRIGGARFKGSGNAGMLDLVLALRWVRANIAAFGGDPDNVTIFGQSGGGQKVGMLMAMPAARGLFHRAIVESGPMPLAVTADYADDLARQLIAELQLPAGDVRALQAVPIERLMRAYYAVYDRATANGAMGIVQGFVPVVDGGAVPRQPFAYGAPSLSAHVPLIIGCTRTEMAGYISAVDPEAYRDDEAAVRRKLRPLLGADTDRMVDAYRAAHPSASPWEIRALITSDWPTRLYSIDIAEKRVAARQAPTWMYRIDWAPAVADGRLMSPHAVEISLVFDTVATATASTGGGPRAQALSDKMSETWLAFARSGRPDNRAIPAWPAYDLQRRATMIWDDVPDVVDDPDRADREAMRRFRPSIA